MPQMDRDERGISNFNLIEILFKIEMCPLISKKYLSYIITVSAVARFIPTPPALVERRKQNLEEFLALNRSILTCLSAPPTLPSILSYCHCW